MCVCVFLYICMYVETCVLLCVLVSIGNDNIPIMPSKEHALLLFGHPFHNWASGGVMAFFMFDTNWRFFWTALGKKIPQQGIKWTGHRTGRATYLRKEGSVNWDLSQTRRRSVMGDEKVGGDKCSKRARTFHFIALDWRTEKYWTWVILILGCAWYSLLLLAF